MIVLYKRIPLSIHRRPATVNRTFQLHIINHYTCPIVIQRQRINIPKNPLCIYNIHVVGAYVRMCTRTYVFM